MKQIENNQKYLLSLVEHLTMNTRHERRQIAMNVSKSFKTNLKDLDTKETVIAIALLEQKLTIKYTDCEYERGRHYRSRMIKLAISYGFTKRDIAKGSVVFDKKKLDQWLLENAFIKKKLVDYSFRELPLLVSEFETVVKDHLKAI